MRESDVQIGNFGLTLRPTLFGQEELQSLAGTIADCPNGARTRPGL
jgi:hypothetical protein